MTKTCVKIVLHDSEGLLRTACPHMNASPCVNMIQHSQTFSVCDGFIIFFYILNLS